MTKRYFRGWTESLLGEGTAYYELEGEWATRQVDQYGDRWFRSDRDSHPEIGLALTDQPFDDEELESMDEITVEQFEEAWERAAGR